MLCFYINKLINFFGQLDEYRKNHFLLDTWMLRDRYREEIVHSEREMDTFLKTTTEKIDNLGQEREKIISELAGKWEVYQSNDDEVAIFSPIFVVLLWNTF